MFTVFVCIITANIFIQYNPLIYQSPESGIEDDSSDSELNDKITYKIGKVVNCWTIGHCPQSSRVFQYNTTLRDLIMPTGVSCQNLNKKSIMILAQQKKQTD